jgi:hypothetical protein
MAEPFGGQSPNRASSIHALWPSAILENFYETASADPSHPGIWCYADRLSYAPGDTILVHSSTPHALYDLHLYRDGAAKTDVFTANGLAGHYYEAPADCSVSGCGWPVAIEIPVEENWPSGGYILHIRAGDGPAACAEHHFPIIIRARAPSAADAILLIACTSTWVAYNDWGGSNFYEGITGDTGNQASPVVSTQRPFSRGFAWLPEGAPRIPLREPPRKGAAIRYPHMEWAYANGFSKKYASAGWASYERHFVHWADAQGLTVDVTTQHDLHAHPEVLDSYACVAVVGHDEYWSWEMRDAVDAYIDRGGNVARFAGNFLWQIRIENEGQTQVCYKANAAAQDPLPETRDRRRLTSMWEDIAVKRPGALTFGLNGTAGMYAGWGGCVPRGSGGFTVYRPEHWVFAGTDLYYGDQLGAGARIFGYEVDGCDYEIRNGLPFATGRDGAPANLQILALGLATNLEADHGNAGSVLFIGDADVREIAFRVEGARDEAALDRHRRGAGMIAFFKRGLGQVFNAATCEWVAGLIARDPFVETITLNVLRAFSQPRQGSAQPSIKV